MKKQSQAIPQIVKERIKELDYQRKNPDLFGVVPTGLIDLDRIIGGMPISDPFVIVLLATKKIGKTTLAMHMAETWCYHNGQLALYFALEEVRYQFADRMMANHADINKMKFIRRDLSDDDIDRMNTTVAKLPSGLYVQDSTFTLSEAREEMLKKNIRLGVFDNMNLHDREGIPGRDDREKLEFIARQLIEYRNIDHLSFIAVAQESDVGRAHGSNEILRGADIIIRIGDVYEQLYDEKGKLKKGDPIDYLRELEVSRSRNLGSGKCQITFDGAHNRIGNLGTVEMNSPAFTQEIQGKQVLA